MSKKQDLGQTLNKKQDLGQTVNKKQELGQTVNKKSNNEYDTEINQNRYHQIL